jgi:hypothetical protein
LSAEDIAAIRHKLWVYGTEDSLAALGVIRQLEAERDRLRDALRPFANESLWTGPQHGFVCIPVSACDRARKALGDKP